MSSHRLTQEQQGTIFSPGSVAIDAGAGSGKTFVLTQRILNLFRTGLQAEELVAVTFTEAAATELRSRLQLLLDQESEQGSDMALHRAAQALPLAQISTIHALCARILREHPVESGVGLRFRVLDQDEAERWLQQNLPEVLGQLPPEEFADLPAALALQAVELMLQDPYRAEEALRTSLATQRDEQQHLEQQREAEKADWEKTWTAALAQLKLYQATDPADPLEQGRQAILQAAQTPGSWEVRLAALRPVLASIRGNAGVARVWGGHKEVIHQNIQALRQLGQMTDTQLELWQCRAVAALGRLYHHAQTSLDRRKAAQEILTFNDLERLAARALSYPEVRDYYAERWKALLVDEFQDTSPLQWQIISALSSTGLNFTVVGDEKQSIYAFRGTDVTLFRKAREYIQQQGGTLQSLNTSFRTHQALIDVLNGFFQGYMQPPATPLSTAATFTPLRAQRQHSPSSSLACELHVITEGEGKSTLRTAEGQLLAHRIQSLMSEGRVVTDGEGTRPLRHQDIAVLFRVRTHLATYEQALFQAGIPYTVRGGTGLLSRPEVRDLLTLLRFVASPDDDLALAAVLRSPLLGWNDRQLLDCTARWQQGQASSGLWETCQSLDPTGFPGLDFLRNLISDSAFLPASSLILRALEHSDFSAVMASLPDGQRRLNNIDAFLGLLNHYASEGQGNIQQVSRTLQESLQRHQAVAEAVTGTQDAVQLLTIHGSKGLEYPVVIVPDLLAEGRQDTSPLLMHEQLGLALKFPGTGTSTQTRLFRQLTELAAERRTSENIRVNYVALTRAADTLILSTTVKSSSEAQKLEDIRQHFPQDKVACYTYIPEDIPRPKYQPPARSGKIDVSSFRTGVALPEDLPVTSLGVYQRCPRAFYYQYVVGQPSFTALWESDTQRREGGIAGAAIGSAVHQAIELGLDEAAVMSRFHHLLLPQRQEVAWLIQQLHLPQFAALLEQKPQREVPIRYPLGNLTFEGIVDALYEDWIVDYKTDQVMQPHHHLTQLSLYAQALEKNRASLVYLRHGVLHTYTSADLQQGQQGIQEAVKGITGHLFDPTPSPAACRFCSFQKICDVSVQPGIAPDC